MKKKDLKTGMQVELRNGDRCVVMIDTPKGDVICDVESGTWAWFDYNEDLTHQRRGDLDIVKVFANEYPGQFISKKMDDIHLVWERKKDTLIEVDGVEYSESTVRSIIKKHTK